ncbi:MAG: glycosyltransferase [Chloroflexi bacterium]|nr:glycosyltransferase [Chloroflexota bacterium]
MNICMVTSSYPRFEGDIAGTFIRALAVHVARLGHQVHVVVPDDGLARRPPLRDEVSGVQVHRFAYAPLQRLRILGYAKSLEGDRHLKPLAYILILPYIMASSVRLQRVVRQFGCRLIHAHWILPSGPVAALIAACWRIPLVISAHGSDVYLAERSRFFRPVARWALSRAAWITACSSNLRERSIGLGAPPSRSLVIPYGVSVEDFEGKDGQGGVVRQSLAIAPADPVILAVGRLVYKKGFEYLVEALPCILERHPTTKLVIAGGGSLAAHLRARATALGVDHALRLPGQIASTDVSSYMAAADVVVIPSITDDSGNVDGLPNVALEAMAAGRAIVATTVGGLAEVIADGKNGLLVPERSPEAIAAAVNTLLSSPDLRVSLGCQAREMVRRDLSWGSVACRFVQLYEQAMSAFVA